MSHLIREVFERSEGRRPHSSLGHSSDLPPLFQRLHFNPQGPTGTKHRYTLTPSQIFTPHPRTNSSMIITCRYTPVILNTLTHHLVRTVKNDDARYTPTTPPTTTACTSPTTINTHGAMIRTSLTVPFPHPYFDHQIDLLFPSTHRFYTLNKIECQQPVLPR